MDIACTEKKSETRTSDEIQCISAERNAPLTLPDWQELLLQECSGGEQGEISRILITACAFEASSAREVVPVIQEFVDHNWASFERLRIAVVVPEREWIAGVIITAMLSRGVWVCAFDDDREAREWLLDGAEEPPFWLRLRLDGGTAACGPKLAGDLL